MLLQCLKSSSLTAKELFATSVLQRTMVEYQMTNYLFSNDQSTKNNEENDDVNLYATPWFREAVEPLCSALLLLLGAARSV